ncbi:MAG TPA: VTT domain-containing protein [Acidimicrobiales bacterium]|nr:VTT domain-containing protein [Acidimicrobiales bacterium]
MLLSLLDFVEPRELIEAFGTIGLFLVVFAESGLFFGFFLPGDSLLFVAGLLNSQGVMSLPLPLLLLGLFLAAVAGDQVGYSFGRLTGPPLFRRADSRLFKRQHLERAHAYFEKQGSKTILLARFIPIVRTFAPIVAGAAQMPYRTFVVFNLLGGLIWAVGVTLLGYLVGETIPDAEKWLLPIVGVIILVSFVPVALEFFRHRRQAR